MKRQKTTFNRPAFNRLQVPKEKVRLDDFILDNEILDELRDKWKPNLNYQTRNNDRFDH